MLADKESYDILQMFLKTTFLFFSFFFFFLDIHNSSLSCLRKQKTLGEYMPPSPWHIVPCPLDPFQ